MLRIGARKLVRRAAVGSVAVASTGLAVYASSEQGQGFSRQVQFWSQVFPVVFDYYWQASSSSPYVKYLQWKQKNNGTAFSDADKKSQQERQKQVLEQLHQRHAPTIFQVMLDLKGLYVKLGQVLSVTTLPIPDPYRVLFRTLQSDVPGWETFQDTIRPVLEQEFGQPLGEIFESMDPIPCGAASIGQAHRAVLKNQDQVIVKVQYPNAAWQVPADIQCVGDFLKVCVFFGVVDDTAGNLSFDEFSRQFLAELDYQKETQNLQQVHQSSLDPSAPYIRRDVVVPKVYPELCTGKVITMSYLAGPKLEEEARRQLEALGIDTNKGLRNLVRDARKNAQENREENSATKSKEDIDSIVATQNSKVSGASNKSSWKVAVTRIVGNVMGFDSILWTVRMARRVLLWSTVAAVKSIQAVSSSWTTRMLLPTAVQEWADEHGTAMQQAQRLALTGDWIDALFDVHGHQIFELGCFNADCHPGNILILDDEKSAKSALSHKQLGLIDFGQCKRLTPQEQTQIAQLVVRVANKESDESVAAAFRDLGIKTKNDSTEYLAELARLMFGPLQSFHLDHAWHRNFHKLDSITYFPSQLSMAYRTSMLLRGLAVSLQVNVSVSDQWKGHAQAAIDRNTARLALEDGSVPSATNTVTTPFVRRLTNKVVKRAVAT